MNRFQVHDHAGVQGCQAESKADNEAKLHEIKVNTLLVSGKTEILSQAIKSL